MNILGIDASDKILGLCLRSQGHQLLTREEPLTHIEQLPSLLADFLRTAEMVPDDLQRVALIRGPGSYTGLRGSVLLARSLAQLKHIPVMTRLWHETVLFALRQAQEEWLICRAVRQNQYYVAHGRFEQGQPAYRLAPSLLEASELLTYAAQHDCCVIGDWPESDQAFVSQPFKQVSQALAEWAEIDFSPVTVESLLPFYVRPAVKLTPENESATQN